MPANPDERASVLQDAGASPDETEELLHYNANRFNPAELMKTAHLPLDDEPFVETWEGYARTAETSGAWTTLRRALPQLRFPVERGISRTPVYRASVLRLEPVPEETPPLRLHRPEDLRITLHQTPAGRLPVLTIPHKPDFVLLTQVFTGWNEPIPVPAALGATMVSGYPNADRMRRLKREWLASHPDATELDWRVNSRSLRLQKAQYLDRFMLASTAPYSEVPATQLGLDAATWQRVSLAIRIEHESVHYFTRRVFGSMQNRLLDELIADYAGLVHATGRYRADWALRFLGLEAFPAYRRGARLEYYRGDPPLSAGAFRVLQCLVKRAAHNLEAYDRGRCATLRPASRLRAVVALTRLTVEDLAATDASRRLEAAHHEMEPLFAPAGSVERNRAGEPPPSAAGALHHGRPRQHAV